MGLMARYWGWRLRRQAELSAHERAAITESVRTALGDSLLQHLEQPVFTGGRRFPRDSGYTVYIFRDGDRDVSAHKVDVEDCGVIGAVWHDDRHSCRWDVSVFVRGGWLSQADFVTARRPLPQRVGKGHADVSNTQARRVFHDPSQQGPPASSVVLPPVVREWLSTDTSTELSGVDVLHVDEVYELDVLVEDGARRVVIALEDGDVHVVVIRPASRRLSVEVWDHETGAVARKYSSFAEWRRREQS